MTKEISGLAKKEIEIQREYYAKTSAQYDTMHFNDKDEHYFALRFLEGVIDFYDIKTILDLGAGTGRVAQYFKDKNPALKVISIEPVSELREIGHLKGLSKDELIDGDATNVSFHDNEFDLVCEFGVLHHIKTPEKVVKEMLRVSRIGLFISDTNNFGQGSFLSRSIKQFINALGLWKLAYLINTKGKGYTISEGDGLGYSYSVFNNYKLISEHCQTHILNTVGAGVNPYKTAPHVALLGIKNSHLASQR
jgi:ubiquinone/menaquinone biosynthesis C-methylase UbiE